MEIYLVRHTKVDIPKNICYGQTDVSLSESFKEESKIVLSKLPNSENFICFSSPLTRCKSLAEIIPSKSIFNDPRLMEFSFGDWELKTWESIGKQAFDSWHSDFVNNRVPNGETYLEVFNRAVVFWEEIISKNENVIIITHGGVIRALLAYILGFPLNNSFRLKIDFGSVSKINYSNGHYSVDFISV